MTSCPQAPIRHITQLSIAWSLAAAVALLTLTPDVTSRPAYAALNPETAVIITLPPTNDADYHAGESATVRFSFRGVILILLAVSGVAYLTKNLVQSVAESRRPPLWNIAAVAGIIVATTAAAYFLGDIYWAIVAIGLFLIPAGIACINYRNLHKALRKALEPPP